MKWSRQDGIAVIVCVMVMLLMAVIGSALVLTTSTEASIAGSFKSANESLYAADAGFEIAAGELAALSDWTAALNGSARSTFVDGPPAGVRGLADGTTLDIGQLVNEANCGKKSACSPADMDAITAERPWAANNPRWQLYAYGKLAELMPGAINSPFYLVVMVADDSSENDNDPGRDGTVATNPGSGIIAIRAEAFGGRGAHYAIEATISRPSGQNPAQAVRVLSWRALR
jgi:hypothetical protein